MITINGKEYRNLQEQVLENMEDIEDLKNREANTLLSTGISAGQVLTADGNGGTEWASGSGGEEAVQAPNTLASGCVVIGTTGGDRNVATLATGTLGYVLTQGVGAPSWQAPAVPDVEGADVKSTGVSSGYVLGADGDGTSSWKLAATGDVSALSSLDVGGVAVGVGTKQISTISGTNGQILYWNGGAAFTDPGIEVEVLG